jgi:hypothetical protein
MKRRSIGLAIVVFTVLTPGAVRAVDFNVGFDGSLSEVTFDRAIVWRAVTVPAENYTGSVLAVGTVVVPDLSASCPTLCVKPATLADHERIVGIVEKGAANTEVALVAVAGITSVQVTGTVTAGDLLEPSSTANGKAMAANSGQDVFAVATTGGTDTLVFCWFTISDTY